VNNTFSSIKQGLEESVEYAQGNKSGVRVYYRSGPDVKAIRDRTGMNQDEFASAIGISLQTLRYWGKRQKKTQRSRPSFTEYHRKGSRNCNGYFIAVT
jgi:putative transcriptional regulator